MLWTVTRVQWTLLKRDRTLWWLLALFVGLLIYAGWSGMQQVAERRDAIAAAHAEEAERLQALQAQLTEQPSSDPYRVGHVEARRVASLPPGPLALLTQQGDDARPTLYAITLDTQLVSPEAASRPMDLGRVSLGGVDMAFVLLYLLPLLIIALTYDLLLGEREQKTLALILSQPISPGTFLLGKLLARAGLILGATLIPTLGFWLASGGGLLPALLGALALLSYIAFWMAAAVATNAWMRSSATSALALMGLWLAALVLVPGLIRIGVETLYPPPSRVTLVNLSRQAAAEAESALKALEGNHGAEAAAEGSTETYQQFLERKIEAHEHMEHALHDVLAEFDEQLAKQQALVQWLQVLSPAVVMREGMSELAGDGVLRHQRFKAQASAFHDAWKARFFGHITRAEPVTAADIEALPVFAFEPEASSGQAGRVLLGLVGIWIPAVLLMLLGLRRVRRVGRL